MSSEAGPLIELARRFRSAGVPSLSSLKSRLSDWEDYLGFLGLVQEFLPERERDILSQPTPEKQIAAFASYFEDRYFPLEDELKMGDMDDYHYLLYRIPVILMGMSYEDYQGLSSAARPGIQLMSYLVANPYEEERSALAEACLKHVSEKLLRRVPKGGLEPDELRRLHGTEFEGLARWAEIIWKTSNNFFLDCDYEELSWHWGLPDWDRKTVEEFARQWRQAEMIWWKIRSLAEWLEEDPEARFEELLRSINEK